MLGLAEVRPLILRIRKLSSMLRLLDRALPPVSISSSSDVSLTGLVWPRRPDLEERVVGPKYSRLVEVLSSEGSGVGEITRGGAGTTLLAAAILESYLGQVRYK